MAMKKNNKNKLPQANKIFTDRDEPRKVFWDNYNSFKENISQNIENEIKIISYYGIGGIGKSSLLKQIGYELNKEIIKPLYISVDLEDSSDQLSILLKIRNLLQLKYGFQFPMFDLAYYTYMKKQGSLIKVDEVDSFLSNSPLLNSILDLTSFLPGAGTIVAVMKGLDSIGGSIGSYFKKRKIELCEIKNDEADKIINNLPYYISCDIERNLENYKEPLVFLIDSYQVLVNELASIGNPLDKDKWLRDEERGLIVNIPNTLWIIGGRDKLKWEKINPDWTGSLEQHLLGSLSSIDCQNFLYQAGISDKELIREIYKLTKGVPLYLDICVDRYHALVNKGLIPSIEDLGSNTYDLVSRFVEYMDDSKKSLLYLLSCLEDWTENSLNIIIRELLPAITFTTINKMENYSFIVTDDNKTYRINQLIKEIIYLDCDMNTKLRINQFMKDYYNKLLNDDSTNRVEFLGLLKKYIHHSLRLEFKSEEDFESFYNRSFKERNLILLQGYQYGESLDILSRLLEFAKENYSTNKAYYLILLDYSIVAYLAGHYKLALETGQKSYDELTRIFGQNSIPSLRAMKLLMVASRKEGDYEKSLTLSKNFYEIVEKIYGKDSIEAIDAYISLAISYRKIGNYKESVNILEYVVNYKTIEFGQDKLTTINSLASLASAYRQAGENHKSFDLSEKVLALYENLYGPYHPTTMAAIGSLAHSARLVGKDDLALELSKQLMENRLEHLGEDHPLSLRAMNNLGNSYRKVGNFDKGLYYAEKLARLRRNILGENHPSTIGALSNLGNSYRLLGDHENSLALAEKVYRWRLEKYGQKHPSVLRAMNNLALDYKLTGEKSKFESLLKSLISIGQDHYGPSHPSLVAAKYNMVSTDYINMDEEDSEDLSEENHNLL